MTPTNSQNNISVRQIARLLKKLCVKNGDILAVKQTFANQGVIEQLSEGLQRMEVTALIVVVDSFDDLTVLNETEMNKRGWYRFEKLARVLGVARQEVVRQND